MSIHDALAERAKKLASIKPTTITGMKSLAKQLKKHYGYAHHVALDMAAKQAGYENFQHARNKLVYEADNDDPA